MPSVLFQGQLHDLAIESGLDVHLLVLKALSSRSLVPQDCTAEQLKVCYSEDGQVVPRGHSAQHHQTFVCTLLQAERWHSVHQAWRVTLEVQLKTSVVGRHEALLVAKTVPQPEPLPRFDRLSMHGHVWRPVVQSLSEHSPDLELTLSQSVPYFGDAAALQFGFIAQAPGPELTHWDVMLVPRSDRQLVGYLKSYGWQQEAAVVEAKYLHAARQLVLILDIDQTILEAQALRPGSNIPLRPNTYRITRPGPHEVTPREYVEELVKAVWLGQDGRVLAAPRYRVCFSTRGTLEYGRDVIQGMADWLCANTRDQDLHPAIRVMFNPDTVHSVRTGQESVNPRTGKKEMQFQSKRGCMMFAAASDMGLRQKFMVAVDDNRAHWKFDEQEQVVQIQPYTITSAATTPKPSSSTGAMAQLGQFLLKVHEYVYPPDGHDLLPNITEAYAQVLEASNVSYDSLDVIRSKKK